MSKTWTYQDPKQLKKVGPDKASWYVGWFDPDGNKRGKSCGPGSKGKLLADKEAEKIKAQLITGTYEATDKKTWDAFRAEYEESLLPGLGVRTGEEIKAALDHFDRLVKPGKVGTLTTARIDKFITARRKEAGKKRGSLVSPATINKELRHLRAVLAVAVEWGYLKVVPKFRMEKVPKKLARFMTGEHFAAVYAACDAVARPADIPNVTVADWWRGVMVFTYMTGWRISEVLALQRADLDLEGGYAITLAEDNKGDRDERVKLHQVVIDHLKRIATFGEFVFPWNHNKTTLYNDFATIQEAAKIHLPCTKKHEHTRFCHVYGFHDLRRAFATMNAARLTPDALQALMRHKSYSTTQLYINMARQIDDAVNVLHVPDVLKRDAK